MRPPRGQARACACLCLLTLHHAGGAFVPTPSAAAPLRFPGTRQLWHAGAPPRPDLRHARARTGRRVAPPVGAEPWDLTGQQGGGDGMFSMPRRNESKMGEATETLRRDFKQQVAASQGLPGFLRGALDPLRLKRNVREARVSSLSRMLEGECAGPLTAEGVADAGRPEVPVSLDEVLVQAQADFAAAVAAESPRLRLDILVPGLNEQIESRFPFDSAMLTDVTLGLASAIAPLRVRHLPAPT